MWYWAFVILYMALRTVEGVTTTAIACPNGWMTLVCPVPMTMISADYGRLDNTICPNGNALGSSALNTTTCSATTSLSVMSSKCNGKLYCSVYVNTGVFGDPCSGIAKYLQATYSCPESAIYPPLLYNVSLVAYCHCHIISATTMTSVVCDANTMSLQCPTGVINIFTANYGRLDNSTCPQGFAIGTFQLSNVTCSAAISNSVVNNACNGKTSCSVAVNKNTFGGDPCVNITKYLTVTYACIDIDQFLTSFSECCSNYCLAIMTQLACESTNLTIQCPSGVIVVLAANYGRLDTTTCGTYSVTNCSAVNSLAIVNNSCNGKQSCTIEATGGLGNITGTFGEPCASIKKYLTVTYYCQVSSTTTTSTTTTPATTSTSTTRTTSLITTTSDIITPTTVFDTTSITTTEPSETTIIVSHLGSSLGVSTTTSVTSPTIILPKTSDSNWLMWILISTVVGTTGIIIASCCCHTVVCGMKRNRRHKRSGF